jgi:hypothetical protein
LWVFFCFFRVIYRSLHFRQDETKCPFHKTPSRRKDTVPPYPGQPDIPPAAHSIDPSESQGAFLAPGSRGNQPLKKNDLLRIVLDILGGEGNEMRYKHGGGILKENFKDLSACLLKITKLTLKNLRSLHAQLVSAVAAFAPTSSAGHAHIHHMQT